MNENTIIAIIVIAVLGSIAGGGFYVYYLHTNIKKELTIARVESQRERALQLKAVAATIDRVRRASQARGRAQTRAQSRAPSLGRSRARSRRQEASLDRSQDQARGKKGKKWKKMQELEPQQMQEDARSRRSSRRPMPSRAGSVRPARGNWVPSDAMATTGGQPQGRQGQYSWPAPAPADSRGNYQWAGQNRDDQNNQSSNSGRDGWSIKGGNERQDTPGDGQNGNTGLNGHARGDDNNKPVSGGGAGWSPKNHQNGASGDTWNSGNNNDSSSRGQQEKSHRWRSPDETANVQQPTQKSDVIDYW